MNIPGDKGKWGSFSLGICGYEVRLNGDCKSVTWLWVGSQKEQIARRAKIYRTLKGRAFFRTPCRRIYIDECVKTGV